MEEVLQIDYNLAKTNVELTVEKLEQNLHKLGIQGYSRADFEKLETRIADSKGKMTNISRYADGHLFNIYGERTPLEE